MLMWSGIVNVVDRAGIAVQDLVRSRESLQFIGFTHLTRAVSLEVFDTAEHPTAS